jgi:plastocyanin
MTNDRYGRRRFLCHAGITLTAGALAGCAGGNGSGDGSGNQTATETETTMRGETTPTATAIETDAPTITDMGTATEAGTARRAETTGAATTAGSTDTQPVTEPAPRRVDRFLEGALFYNGDMVVGVPFVAVGASTNNLGFDPAAIKVATGTEVTWQWVSGEEQHSITSVETGGGRGVLNRPPKAGSDVTYRHTFTSPGIYLYVCGIHRTQNARGAVVVAPGSDVGGPGPG